jgi:hypothetical protein
MIHCNTSFVKTTGQGRQWRHAANMPPPALPSGGQLLISVNLLTAPPRHPLLNVALGFPVIRFLFTPSYHLIVRESQSEVHRTHVRNTAYLIHTAKTQYRKIWNRYSQKKKLRGYSPNIYIHVSMSDLYIPLISQPILLQENRWTGGNMLTWMWKLGLRLRNSFSGNT